MLPGWLGPMVAAIGVAVLVPWLSKVRRRRWSAWLSREADRFVLRVHAPGPRSDHARLGTSIEGGATPSNEPEIEAEEVILEDDGKTRILIPTGQKLSVRSFDGARRTALDHVTASSGTRTRYSFDVPAMHDFWILDARATVALEPDAERVGTQRLPLRSEPWELTTRRHPLPDDLERLAPRLRWPIVLAGLAIPVALLGFPVAAWVMLGVAGVRLVVLAFRTGAAPALPPGAPVRDEPILSLTLSQYEHPLWTQRLGDAESWLLAPRSSPGRAIVVDMVDPHSPPGVTQRDEVVGSTAFAISDAIWMRTDLAAVNAIPLVIGRARVHRTGQLPPYGFHGSFVAQFEGRSAFIWGEAGADLGVDGFRLRLRATEEPGTSEDVLEAPMPELAERVIDWLVEKGFCRRVEPPPGFHLPAALDLYRRVLDDIVVQSLTHRRNRALPPLPASFHLEALGRAEDLARAETGLLARLVWIVSAIYVHELAALPDDAKARVLEAVRSAAETDPLHRLAPMILVRLGLVDEGRALRDRRLAEARGPYRDEAGAYAKWLAGVGAED